FPNAGHLSHHRTHEHAGRITSLAAGRVDAHPRERRHPAREGDARLLVCKGPQLFGLMPMVFDDAVARLEQGFPELWCDALEGLLTAVVRDQHSVDAALLEALDMAAHGVVAFGTNLLEDLAYRRIDS